MRVLLRSVKDRLYYAGAGRPLTGLERAVKFASVERAGEIALNEELADMEIVLCYDDVACEVRLPVRPDWFEPNRCHWQLPARPGELGPSPWIWP